MDLTFMKKLTETAQLPTQANPLDAGWDLYADEDVEIWPGEVALISTGISLEIPEGYVGLIWDRSSLGVKGVHRHAGVIDSGYRGEVKVCLHNTNTSTFPKHVATYADKGVSFTASKGDRIAQILFQKVPLFNLVESNDLAETTRGAEGFGSSGK